MKIYCENCKFMEWGDYDKEECYHNQNLNKNFYPTKSINKLNGNNDCAFYERIWWKFWI